MRWWKRADYSFYSVLMCAVCSRQSVSESEEQNRPVDPFDRA